MATDKDLNERIQMLRERLPTLWIFHDGHQTIANNNDLSFFYEGVRDLVKEEREKAVEEGIEFEHRYIAFITKCNHESISNEEVGKRLREYLTKKESE